MKNFKKTLALALAAAVSVSTVFVASPAEAQAASSKVSVTLKAKAGTTKATISGLKKSVTITAKYNKKTVKAAKVKYTIDKKGKSVISVSKKGVIKSKKAGTATVTAKYTVKKKIYSAKIKVTVTIPTTKVKLNKSKATIKTNSTVKLKVTLKPANTTDVVTWKTSNKKVATVSKKGVVKGVAVGTATITAFSGKKKATATITVNPTTFKQAKKTASVTVGKKTTLGLTVNPSSSKVTWTSSNTKFATVTNKGVVKGVKAGTATITATCGGLKRTWTITVKAASTTVAVTGVSVKLGANSLVVGKTTTATATITPSNATTTTVTWSSNNTKVATVDKNGKVTAVAAGTADIIATSNNKKTGKATITVTAAANGACTFDGVYYTYDLTSTSKVSKGSKNSVVPVVDLIKSDVEKLATKTNKAWTVDSLVSDLSEIFAKSGNSALLKKAGTSLFAAGITPSVTKVDGTVKVVIGTKTYEIITVDDSDASVHKLTFTAGTDTMTAEVARDASAITIKSGNDVVYSFKKTTTGYEFKLRKSAYDDLVSNSILAEDFVNNYTVSK